MDSPKPNGRNDGHQFDHSQITPQIFIGSDLCKRGVCLIHEVEFAQLGVEVELNLSKENNELPPKSLKSYTWLPAVDGYAPSQNQLSMGTSIMNEAVKAGKKVYVHCRNGHGRSPTLVAAYLIRFNKMNVDQAIDLISQKRPEVHIEEIQKKALNEFTKLL